VSHCDAPRRNVELKAVCADLLGAHEVCRALGAADHGVLIQRDTYFSVASGGLKLREESPGRPHLIQFSRADEAAARLSSYRVVFVDDAGAMRDALGAALGIRGAVAKRRHLFLWCDVRIHLDEVDGLGAFIELEAVAPAGSDLSLEYRRVAALRESFGITDARVCATGYAAQLGL
jgi:adenylate cyclase class 2